MSNSAYRSEQCTCMVESDWLGYKQGFDPLLQHLYFLMLFFPTLSSLTFLYGIITINMTKRSCFVSLEDKDVEEAVLLSDASGGRVEGGEVVVVDGGVVVEGV